MCKRVPIIIIVKPEYKYICNILIIRAPARTQLSSPSRTTLLWWYHYIRYPCGIPYRRTDIQLYKQLLPVHKIGNDVKFTKLCATSRRRVLCFVIDIVAIFLFLAFVTHSATTRFATSLGGDRRRFEISPDRFWYTCSGARILAVGLNSCLRICYYIFLDLGWS